MFRFNSGAGGITCDKCGILYCDRLSPVAYETLNRLIKTRPSERDLCPPCSDSPRKRRRPLHSAKVVVKLLTNSEKMKIEKQIELFGTHLEEHRNFLLLFDAKFAFRNSILLEVLEEENARKI